MAGSKELTIQALNTYLEDLKKENERPGYITLSTFDSMSIDIPITKTSLEEITYFSNDILQPRGGTPLFDAIGIAMHDLENIGESSDNSKVLVIVTDGLENASKEYSYDDVRKKTRLLLEPYYHLVYVEADINSLKTRDTKGLYKASDEGLINNLIGYSEINPYEAPSDANFVVNTSNDISVINSKLSLLGFVKTITN